MKQLLVLTPTTAPDSGWGRYANAVIRHLRERYDLRVVDDLPDPLSLLSRPDEIIRAVLRVRRAAANCDAICSLVAYPYALVAALATLGTRRPYFVSCHGTYAVEPLHTKHRPFAKWAFRRAARLFPVSQFTADRIRAEMPALRNLTVVPNGVDVEGFRPAEPFDLDGRVLLTVGAFKPRKGQHLSVEAFGHVADELPDVDYHLVGAGAEREYARSVRQTARRHGVSDRVRFEGNVPDEDLERWYATADVFVLTPQYVDHHFEGFGLVYLEANRYGIPVVGTTGTGAEDAIADGRSGLCVEHDPGSVAAALRELFTDEQRYQTLSTGAREWATEHEWDRCLDRMTTAIDAELR